MANRRQGITKSSSPGSGLSSGVDFYRVQAGKFVLTRKLLLLSADDTWYTQGSEYTMGLSFSGGRECDIGGLWRTQKRGWKCLWGPRACRKIPTRFFSICPTDILDSSVYIAIMEYASSGRDGISPPTGLNVFKQNFLQLNHLH